MSRSFLPIFLPFCLLACNQGEGKADIQCTAVPEQSWGCDARSGDFTFEADFFALHRRQSIDGGVVDDEGPTDVEIRLQRGGRGTDLADGFFIQIFDVDTTKRCNQSILFEASSPNALDAEHFPGCRSAITECKSPSDCPALRVGLHFPSSCPDSTQPLIGGGQLPDGGMSSIFFQNLQTRVDSTTRGSFEIAFSDARTGAPVGVCRTDDFWFAVKAGQPYVRFIE